MADYLMVLILSLKKVSIKAQLYVRHWARLWALGPKGKESLAIFLKNLMSLGPLIQLPAVSECTPLRQLA